MNLPLNPLFRRYTRSQMRPLGASLRAITVLIITCFFFFLAYLGSTRLSQQDPVIAARIALIPLLTIQYLILLFRGTAATTLGYVREVDEGMADYQRLTPLSPLRKTLGYLFGIPVFYYLMVLMIMPFVLFCIIRGEIPLRMVLEVYISLFSSAVLYHLTGIVAGTILKHRMLAGLVSLGIVICINVIFPRLISQTGYQFLSYITIWPVLFQHGTQLAMDSSLLLNDPNVAGNMTEMNAYLKGVPFWGTRIRTLYFSLLIQGTLSATFLLILVRRWRDANHHLLGKISALVLSAWILFLFIGSSLPLIETGDIFPSRQSARLSAMTFGQITFVEGYILAIGCGVVTLIFANTLVGIITPNRHQYLTGLRRAVKSGRNHPPFMADERSSLVNAILIALMGSIAWAVFSQHLFGSRFLNSASLAMSDMALMFLVFLLAVLCFWSAAAYGGKKLLYMGMFCVWVVPLMIAAILGILGYHNTSIYVAAGSVVTAFFGCFSTIFADNGLPKNEIVAHTLWIWGVLHLVILGVLTTLNIRTRRSIVGRVTQEATTAATSGMATPPPIR